MTSRQQEFSPAVETVGLQRGYSQQGAQVNQNKTSFFKENTYPFDLSLFPFNCIGCIESSNPSKQTLGQIQGTLVGPFHVLASACSFAEMNLNETDATGGFVFRLPFGQISKITSIQIAESNSPLHEKSKAVICELETRLGDISGYIGMLSPIAAGFFEELQFKQINILIVESTTNVIQAQVCDMIEPNTLKLQPVATLQNTSVISRNKVALLFDKLFGYVVIGVDCCFDGLYFSSSFITPPHLQNMLTFFKHQKQQQPFQAQPYQSIEFLASKHNMRIEEPADQDKKPVVCVKKLNNQFLFCSYEDSSASFWHIGSLNIGQTIEKEVFELDSHPEERFTGITDIVSEGYFGVAIVGKYAVLLNWLRFELIQALEFENNLTCLVKNENENYSYFVGDSAGNVMAISLDCSKMALFEDKDRKIHAKGDQNAHGHSTAIQKILYLSSPQSEKAIPKTPRNTKNNPNEEDISIGYLLVVSEDGIRLWDRLKCKVKSNYEGISKQRRVYFLAQFGVNVLIGESTELKEYQWWSGRVMRVVKLSFPISCGAILSDKEIAIGEGKQLRIYNMISQESDFFGVHRSTITHIITINGSIFITADAHGTIYKWTLLPRSPDALLHSKVALEVSASSNSMLSMYSPEKLSRFFSEEINNTNQTFHQSNRVLANQSLEFRKQDGEIKLNSENVKQREYIMIKGDEQNGERDEEVEEEKEQNTHERFEKNKQADELLANAKIAERVREGQKIIETRRALEEKERKKTQEVQQFALKEQRQAQYQVEMQRNQSETIQAQMPVLQNQITGLTSHLQQLAQNLQIKQAELQKSKELDVKQQLKNKKDLFNNENIPQMSQREQRKGQDDEYNQREQRQYYGGIGQKRNVEEQTYDMEFDSFKQYHEKNTQLQQDNQRLLEQHEQVHSDDDDADVDDNKVEMLSQELENKIQLSQQAITIHNSFQNNSQESSIYHHYNLNQGQAAPLKGKAQQEQQQGQQSSRITQKNSAGVVAAEKGNQKTTVSSSSLQPLQDQSSQLTPTPHRLHTMDSCESYLEETDQKQQEYIYLNRNSNTNNKTSARGQDSKILENPVKGSDPLLDIRSVQNQLEQLQAQQVEMSLEADRSRDYSRTQDEEDDRNYQEIEEQYKQLQLQVTSLQKNMDILKLNSSPEMPVIIQQPNLRSFPQSISSTSQPHVILNQTRLIPPLNTSNLNISGSSQMGQTNLQQQQQKQLHLSLHTQQMVNSPTSNLILMTSPNTNRQSIPLSASSRFYNSINNTQQVMQQQQQHFQQQLIPNQQIPIINAQQQIFPQQQQLLQPLQGVNFPPQLSAIPQNLPQSSQQQPILSFRSTQQLQQPQLSSLQQKPIQEPTGQVHEMQMQDESLKPYEIRNTSKIQPQQQEPSPLQQKSRDQIPSKQQLRILQTSPSLMDSSISPSRQMSLSPHPRRLSANSSNIFIQNSQFQLANHGNLEQSQQEEQQQLRSDDSMNENEKLLSQLKGQSILMGEMQKLMAEQQNEISKRDDEIIRLRQLQEMNLNDVNSSREVERMQVAEKIMSYEASLTQLSQQVINISEVAAKLEKQRDDLQKELAGQGKKYSEKQGIQEASQTEQTNNSQGQQKTPPQLQQLQQALDQEQLSQISARSKQSFDRVNELQEALQKIRNLEQKLQRMEIENDMLLASKNNGEQRIAELEKAQQQHQQLAEALKAVETHRDILQADNISLKERVKTIREEIEAKYAHTIQQLETLIAQHSQKTSQVLNPAKNFAPVDPHALDKLAQLAQSQQQIRTSQRNQNQLSNSRNSNSLPRYPSNQNQAPKQQQQGQGNRNYQDYSNIGAGTEFVNRIISEAAAENTNPDSSRNKHQKDNTMEAFTQSFQNVPVDVQNLYKRQQEKQIQQQYQQHQKNQKEAIKQYDSTLIKEGDSIKSFDPSEDSSDTRSKQVLEEQYRFINSTNTPTPRKSAFKNAHSKLSKEIHFTSELDVNDGHIRKQKGDNGEDPGMCKMQ